MIKKTLCFSNPAYLSLRDAQLLIRFPEIETNEMLTESFKKESERTIPIEDIGVVVLDNRRITITSGVLEALLENNAAVITCDQRSMPVGLLLPLTGNTTQNERFRDQLDVVISGKRSPLMIAAQQTTASLYKCFSSELRHISYPEM